MTPEDEARRPGGLGPRGSALWDDVLARYELDPMGRGTLVEACRIADRLEVLEAMLRDGAVTRFLEGDEDDTGRHVTVVVSDLVSEIRAHSGTLRLLLTSTRAGASARRALQRSGLDELRQQRERRDRGAS